MQFATESIGYAMHDAGYWMLQDAGYQIPDAGYWMLSMLSVANWLQDLRLKALDI
jgi:hypothetical protein